MSVLKQQLLDELMEHLSTLQGGGLKSLLDESKKPKLPEPGLEDSESEESDLLKPQGLKVESVELQGEPKSFDEKADSAIEEISPDKDPASETDMSDEELKELLSKLI